MENIWKIAKLLFPLNRSLTGEGNRETLSIIKKSILPSLEIKRIKSGSKVFDWNVPPEWNVRDAYVKNKFGEKIIDFSKNNLHLVNYSAPFKGIIEKKELLKHIHILEEYPDLIPYRTSYYSREWGFCTTKNIISSKKFEGGGPFEVLIDSEFKEDGELIWAEDLKQGKIKEEIIISTYFCHPSLANDNLSGLVTSLFLFYYLKNIETKYTYRLVIVPETIGSICFLAQSDVKKIVGGMILSCTGGPDRFSIKDSFDKNHWINITAHKALEEFTKKNYITYPFVPIGSDERQYSSPAFRIVTPSIHKSKYHEFKEYHTSADNLEFISEDSLLKSLEVHKLWIKYIESYKVDYKEKTQSKKDLDLTEDKKPSDFCIPKRKEMACEYQLGKRGLYLNIGGTINQPSHLENADGFAKRIFNFAENSKFTGRHLDAFYWLMHLADGNNSNYKISEKSGIELKIINEAIALFYQKNLIVLR
tara:strand:- start:2028 stop:3455 length:1428 start_codon:yes stop_codon:yes gene_type:complete